MKPPPAFRLASDLGHLQQSRVDIYAHALLAVLTEMALLVARAEDQSGAADAGRDAVELVLSQLMGVHRVGTGRISE